MAVAQPRVEGAAQGAGDRKTGTWTRFRRHRMAVFGLGFLVLVALTALFAPVVAPHDPTAFQVGVRSNSPSATYPLGLDNLSRDNLSRLIFGARVSLAVGLVAVSIYVVIGTALGALAGYFGGAADILLTRLADAVLSFPSIMLIMIIVSVIGPSIWNVMMVLGLLGWPSIFRIVRGQFLSLRAMDFVQAGRALGASDLRLILRHLLPNSLSPILVAATFGMASAVLSEAALSFLGLGVQPPTPSWGGMLIPAQVLGVMERQPWIWLPPGLAIFMTALAINFVGDGLRDALDPRLKR